MNVDQQQTHRGERRRSHTDWRTAAAAAAEEEAAMENKTK